MKASQRTRPMIKIDRKFALYLPNSQKPPASDFGESTSKNRWIAERPGMGHPDQVSFLINRNEPYSV